MDLKNLSFGLMAFKMVLKVHNGKLLGTSSEQLNLELGQNSDVLTKLDFWPFGLENGLDGQFGDRSLHQGRTEQG